MNAQRAHTNYFQGNQLEPKSQMTQIHAFLAPTPFQGAYFPSSAWATASDTLFQLRHCMCVGAPSATLKAVNPPLSALPAPTIAETWTCVTCVLDCPRSLHYKSVRV
ncbi:uncharacterized protein N7500_008895 [Penicillium coprophilum]|uniref:uncharacterized protein n=1 Tax=Penicillium coprophilum TaxID=36646 RepID=UPI0023A11240|nr:uncharacterized protein N7500_008895 [Penicillium coprophilum]KAJ5159244.1 hypothetical protein N7500_008895 [Penicillium coprophilum]